MLRGELQFEVDDSGRLLNSARNVETLRRMWLHPTLVSVDDIGPGDRGDFGNGAWHVSCHLAGAGGVMRGPSGNLMWLEISHADRADYYHATITTRLGGATFTHPLDSAEGRALLSDSKLEGFVEGTSLGRTSSRRVQDSPQAFGLWRRQDFDQPLDSAEDGGKVWEHWCTLRDIRPSHVIGTSVVTAYVSLVAALGDRFTPTVARGRRDYGHPVQLAAMVWAGLCSRESATWETKPLPIPEELESLFLQAEPALALDAVEKLSWGSLRYYMYSRKLASWSTVAQVRKDLEQFKPE